MTQSTQFPERYSLKRSAVKMFTIGLIPPYKDIINSTLSFINSTHSGTHNFVYFCGKSISLDYAGTHIIITIIISCFYHYISLLKFWWEKQSRFHLFWKCFVFSRDTSRDFARFFRCCHNCNGFTEWCGCMVTRR